MQWRAEVEVPHSSTDIAADGFVRGYSRSPLAWIRRPPFCHAMEKGGYTLRLNVT